MSALKAAATVLHDLPATVEFTMSDGTSLNAEVRISARSRRAKLSFTPRGELVLSIPLTMGPEQLQASLPLFLPWLERNHKTLLRRVPDPELPQRICLPLTGEIFAVFPCGDMAAGRRAATGRSAGSAMVRVASGARRLLLVECEGQLNLYGAVEDLALDAQALRLWCRQKAAHLLPPYLEMLAAKEGFALAGVSVRDQRSRWGSCSRIRPGQNLPQKLPQRSVARPRTLEQLTSRIHDFFSTPAPALASDAEGGIAPEGRISLNWRALLLPTPLLEHLCWHELCHLRHMNHSTAYRAELARFSPQWPEHEKALNTAWRGLPWWALPGNDTPPSCQ